MNRRPPRSTHGYSSAASDVYKTPPGKYGQLVFALLNANDDGSETLVHEVPDDAPECVVFGVTEGLIKPLEAALDGLSAGDSYDVVALPEEAFGCHNPEEVVELGREVFEIDGKFDEEHIKKGVRLPMMTADGYRIEGLVVDVTPEYVKMDFNHQLVDCKVRIKGTVKTVRDVTEEDLRPAGGCCGCHGGDCGDGGCGDGCGEGGCGGCH